MEVLGVRLDENGWEILDPTPMEIPAGFKRPPTLAEQVARLVRSEQWKRDMEASDVETFEESEDFGPEEDGDPSSPFEEFFDPSIGRYVTPADVLRDEELYKRLADQYRAANAKPEDIPPPSPPPEPPAPEKP